MARTSKGPWLKNGTTWYVQVNGKKINLGKNKDTANERWLSIMEKPAHLRGLMASRFNKDVRKKLIVARKNGRIIERAATLMIAESYGIKDVRFGNPRTAMIEAFRNLSFFESAKSIVDDLESFGFLPDGWDVQFEGTVVAVCFIEIEYKAPMGVAKMLRYAKLSADLKKIGGSFLLLVGNRYGVSRELDIEAFAAMLKKASKTIKGDDLV